MIIDRIANAHLYYSLSPSVEECLRYLAEEKYPLEPTARFPISERASFNVSQYVPKPLEAREWEAHDRCVDLQVVLKGRESISWASREQMTYTGTQEGKDHLCYEGEGAILPLTEGFFCILFPDDVHRTKTRLDSDEPVLKGVFKIKL